MKKTIDITEILARDLKTRIMVHDLDLYLKNAGEEEYDIDFSKVNFATRSFVDEFYQVLLKTTDKPYKISLANVPDDIGTILKTIESGVDLRSKDCRIANIKMFDTIDEFLKYFSPLSYQQ